MSGQKHNAQPESRRSLPETCRDLAAAPWRVSGSPETDDLAQDAYLRALESDAPVRSPVAYLMRIARNLFIDRRRRQMREATLFQPALEPERAGTDRLDPERVLAGKQELRLALSAVAALPPRCREAFLLHRFEGLGYAAVARRMGVSVSMVEKHIAEAMRRIAAGLRAGGGS